MGTQEIVKKRLQIMLRACSPKAQKAYLKDAYYIMKKVYKKERRIMPVQEALCQAMSLEYRESDYVQEKTDSVIILPETSDRKQAEED
jgi:hypothetical protein